ncbi:MusI family membrane protein [Corynebacterium gerontici]|uniref:DUF624 domain-containing protein n=1 Tax=Corynebacterium gerontici TaxID=2079234 RepID=A0A3G6J2E7_9CORY|nr:DUF624 domain-containing protein [Corynebacterium gerontici]AZA12076.1 hypothetical protein CGERO_08925 [Corynebacterium gerontici]
MAKSKFFDPESRFQAALALFAELVIINILALLCSLPLVTIGAAAKATATMTAQLVREEGSKTIGPFFQAFRRHAAPSLAWGLIVLAAMLLALYELAVLNNAGIEGTVGMLLRAGLLSGLLVIAAICVWFFPLQENGRLGFAQGVSRATQMAVLYLPRTLGSLLLPIVALMVWMFMPEQRGMLLGFHLICLPALCAYIANLLVQPVLRLNA